MTRAFATVVCVLLAGPALASDHGVFDERDCTRTETQRDLNHCTAENLDAANRTLTDVYRAVMARQETEAARRALREAERAWVDFKDGKCAADAGPRGEGGSMWPTNWAYCEIEVTKKRIRELNGMRCGGERDCYRR